MQRRLELAATLIHDPEMIFLDEPTAGIDPVLRARFWEHFRALRDEGRTLVVTTQYVTEAEYCDEILVLRDGEAVAMGTPEDVRRLAMGGEVVTVAGERLDRHARSVIEKVPGVSDVSWRSANRLDVIVEDAGTAVPVLMEALREADIEVDEVIEQHPSFDDVFVRLMARTGRCSGQSVTSSSTFRRAPSGLVVLLQGDLGGDSPAAADLQRRARAVPDPGRVRHRLQGADAGA